MVGFQGAHSSTNPWPQQPTLCIDKRDHPFDHAKGLLHASGSTIPYDQDPRRYPATYLASVTPVATATSHGFTRCIKIASYVVASAVCVWRRLLRAFDTIQCCNVISERVRRYALQPLWSKQPFPLQIASLCPLKRRDILENSTSARIQRTLLSSLRDRLTVHHTCSR